MKETFLKTTGIFLICLLAATVVFGQNSDKELKKQIKEKAMKDARKAAKDLEKDDWFVQPGSLPIDKQVEKGWMMQYEEDDMGYPKYYVGVGTSLAGTQSAAKLQASTIAKQDLAGRISSSMASIVETNLSTTQLTADEAATVQETISASTEVIAQQLARILTLTELYRKNGKNFECQLRIAYSTELANEAAKEVVKKALSEKSDVAREKLDKLMNF